MLCVAFEVMLVLLHAFTSDYGDAGQGNAASSHSGVNDGGVGFYYPFYQDVHVMLAVGFGLLETVVARYSWSAVGYNFLLLALAIQWSLLTIPFFVQANAGPWRIIQQDIVQLINGDFAGASLMISFGAVMGKASATQLLVMTFFEMIFYGMNFMVVYNRIKAVDMGGSLVIHVFGAYFGLAASWMLGNPARDKDGKGPSPSMTKMSATLSMVGTLFLWCFWPSFNGALATNSQQHRVVVNTVLSLCASCVFTMATSRLLRPSHKFDFEDLANATLSGGVAVGCAADLVIKPWGAILIGLVAGAGSTIGFRYISSIMDRYLKVHDTLGVHNLHGMPGILGGLAGAVSAGIAGSSSYGTNIGLVFPARAPSDPIAAAALGLSPGDDRSAIAQGGFQMAAILVSMAFGIGGGLFTGFIMRQPICDPMVSNFYDDKYEWELAHLEDQTYSEGGAHAIEDAEKGAVHAAEVELTAVPHGSSDYVLRADVAAIVAEEVRKALSAAATEAAAAVAPVAQSPA